MKPCAANSKPRARKSSKLPPAPELSLDAVYAHDASLATDFGLIVMRPGKANRVAEGRNHGSFCARLGIPTLAKIVAPGNHRSRRHSLARLRRTLLVGHGYRTNAAGIAQMRALLAPKGVDSSIRAAARTAPARPPVCT